MTTGKKLVALVGQPNCGKSTVFNALTGANQLVANYPGVTVDKMVGWFRHDGEQYELIDLPGTYSQTSYSPEERVTRDFLLDSQARGRGQRHGRLQPETEPLSHLSAPGNADAVAARPEHDGRGQEPEPGPGRAGTGAPPGDPRDPHQHEERQRQKGAARSRFPGVPFNAGKPWSPRGLRGARTGHPGDHRRSGQGTGHRRPIPPALAGRQAAGKRRGSPAATGNPAPPGP